MSAEMVAVITRLSPRSDRNYEGMDVQEAWGREYAASHWPGLPVEVFADEGISATKGDERPELERFLDLLAVGRIAHVCATWQSRVSRETAGRYPWFHIAGLMAAAGVEELHTRHEGVIQVQGEVAGIKAVLADIEVRRLRQRVNDVKDAARQDGNLRKLYGGTPVLGYRQGSADWEPEPGAVALLRDAAVRVLTDPEHEIQAAAEDALKGHPDVRDAAGRRPNPKVIRAALRRPLTAGLIADREGRLRFRAAVAEPPLDEATWRRLERIFADRRHAEPGDRVERDSVYWAGPLLRCGKCGNILTGELLRYRGIERPTYRCKNPHKRIGVTRPCHGCSVQAVDVNAMLRAAVEAWAETDPEFAAASQVRAGQATERDRVAAELAAERRGFGELAIRWRSFDADQWAVMAAEHDAVVDRLAAELAELDDALAGPPMGAELDWEKLTGDERRAYVSRALVVPVEVAPGNGGAAALTAAQRVSLRVRGANVT